MLSGHSLEQRIKDPVLLFEGDAHSLLEAHLFNRAVDDVGREIDARYSIQPHPGNDERHLQPRYPSLVVDGVCLDCASARNGSRRDIFRMAVATDRLGRVHVFPAITTPRDVELAVLATSPEGAVLSVKPWPGAGWWIQITTHLRGVRTEESSAPVSIPAANPWSL